MVHQRVFLAKVEHAEKSHVAAACREASGACAYRKLAGK